MINVVVGSIKVIFGINVANHTAKQSRNNIFGNLDDGRLYTGGEEPWDELFSPSYRVSALVAPSYIVTEMFEPSYTATAPLVRPFRSRIRFLRALISREYAFCALIYRD